MLGLGISLADGAVRAQRLPELALDFRNRRYRQAPLSSEDPGALAGYSYSRSGAKQELSGGGGLTSFAAGVPGIVPGIGYWARQGLTNLLLRSQEFEASSWTKVATVSTNAAAAPDGTQTADKLVESSTNTHHLLHQSGGTAAQHTFSVFAKPAGRSAIVLRLYNASNDWENAVFDLATGAMMQRASGSATTFTGISTAVAPAGDGWHRCSITATFPASSRPCVVQLANAATGLTFTSNGENTYLGNGSSGVHLWQAQLVASSQAGPVIVTTTAAASVGADDLRLSALLQDEDFAFWAVVNFPVAATAGTSLASLSGGTNANLISLQRTSAGALAAVVSAGGTAQSVGGGLGVSVTTGRTAILLRRRAGKFTEACKTPSGTVTIASEGPAAAMPAINLVHPGCEPGGLQARGTVEFVGIRKGTLSDAEIGALLQAA